MKNMLRALAYLWAAPATLAGCVLVLAARASGGQAAVVSGVIEAHGGVMSVLLRRAVPLRGGASAMTLGHVVVGRDAGCLDRTRAHEREHVRQFEQWGPFFIPAYVVASIVPILGGRHYYRDNTFERRAMAAADRFPGDLAGRGRRRPGS